MTPESRAIRNLELMSMNPQVAERYEWDMAVANSQCPKCKGQGGEKMDAYPNVVCRDCGCMFDPYTNTDFSFREE